MTVRSILQALCFTVTLLAAGAPACAQRGGGMGPGGGGMGGGMGPGGMGGMNGGMNVPRGGMGVPSENRMPDGNLSRGTPPPNGGSTASSMRGGLQLGPPGRWWDDKKFAKSLGLNGDQQKKMDTIFGQNRDLLVSRYANLQHAESRLESLTHTAHPAEAALFSEIDHVAQARADLEKAAAHYLLLIREEMTPEQIGRLEEHR